MVSSPSFFEMRRRNISDVLNCVREKPGISRAELANEVGLAKATVSTIVDELIGKAALEEAGVKASSGGRPGVGLQFNPKYGFVFGICLDASEISACLMDLNGSVIKQFDSKIDQTWNGTRIAELLMEKLNGFLKELSVSMESVLGVGIAVPGPVRDEVSTDTASTYLESAKVKQILALKTGCVPVIDSNTNMAALAELGQNQIADSELVFVVRIGHQIRSAVMVSGSPLSGSRGLSGEFGHIAVPNNKRLCTCGSRGCINTVASYAAMIQMAHDAGLKVRTIRGLIDLAEKENQLAQAICSEAGKAIGFGIAQVINLLAPHVVIVAGPAIKDGNQIMRYLRKKVTKTAKLENRNNCRIITSTLNGYSECVGAGFFALRRLIIADTLLPFEKFAVS